MLTFKQYIRPASLEEAYTLCQKKRNMVLGGMIWTKMYDKAYDTAIDLCDLGLDRIEEDAEGFSIGAYVKLRDIEIHAGLNNYTSGAVEESVKHIVGVQLRNCATIGGSIWGRFGFSDVLTMFLALEAQVELYHAGVMPLTEFITRNRNERDILVRVLVPKKKNNVVYLSQRNSSTDFPTLTCAVARDEKGYVCAIGARPSPALLIRDEEGILTGLVTPEAAAAFGTYVAGQLNFKTNSRCSAAYREAVCKVLVKRAVLQGSGTAAICEAKTGEEA